MRITHTNNFYLVIYTDENSLKYINLSVANNNNIRVIIKPIEELNGYQYKDKWISNHERNRELNTKTGWILNMIWSEKVYFVQDTMQQKYFDETDFYGWCDIGCFRNRPNIDMDIKTFIQKGWPKPECISKLDQSRVMYSMANTNPNYLKQLHRLIHDKNEHGLPNTPIPSNQISISGSFFIAHKSRVDWWVETYTNKLKLYFDHEYLVKDDQIIIIDCIFSDISNFALLTKHNRIYDPWFAFQRFLCDLP
jgi:hypothetical protein